MFIPSSPVAFLLKHLIWLLIVHQIKSELLSLDIAAVQNSIQPGFLLLHGK